MFPLVLILSSIVLACFIWYIYKFLFMNSFKYFKEQGIPGRTPVPIFGTCWNCWKKNEHDIMIEDYKTFGNIYGTYQGSTPYLNIADPELLQAILKDGFSHFDSHDRRTINTDDDYTNLSLASLTGSRWRQMRGIVGASLSPSQIKQNMDRINRIGEKIVSRWQGLAKNQDGKFDVQVESQCWLIEVTAKILFSMDDIDIIGNPKHAFVTNAEEETGSFKETMMSTLFFLYPQYAYLQRNKKVSGHKYFVEIIRRILKSRNENRVEPEKNDAITMLCDHLEKESLKIAGGISPDEREKLIVSQIAGGLTSSHDIGSVLSRVIHCLAMNPEAQCKARTGVEEGLMKHDGVITFNLIREMPYLEQCIYEASRLYSTFNRISRVCNKEITYGKIFIPVGTAIRVPSYAMDHDERYYPDPYKFDPERFSPEQVAARHPMVFLPFGAGPRDCPARFIAPLMLKQSLCHLLKNFKFSPVPETVDPLPCTSGLSAAVAVMQKMWIGIEQL